ncbi:MAG TPA: copper-binding protein [Sedimenticola sp.]|nr:copper-binding protein [Sedimenticola sp.]
MKLKTIAMSLGLIAFGTAALAPHANAEGAFPNRPLMLAAAQNHHGVGTVTQIDRKGRRVELKHGPIKSIGWMAMTMFFEVEDADLLDEIEVGDEVDFDFIETRDKRYVITDIETRG